MDSRLKGLQDELKHVTNELKRSSPELKKVRVSHFGSLTASQGSSDQSKLRRIGQEDKRTFRRRECGRGSNLFCLLQEDWRHEYSRIRATSAEGSRRGEQRPSPFRHSNRSVNSPVSFSYLCNDTVPNKSPGPILRNNN